MRLPFLFLAIAFLAPRSGQAQFPPDRVKNLKVLPADIPVRALIDTMAGFTRALGVRCTYCHVGSEDIPLAQYDFVSDEKAPKGKAREMLRMVGAINTEYLARLTDRREPRIVVTCATCHRGLTQPRPLQQVLLSAYDAAGADSAEALYRALRHRYYGSAAYDFGEVPLADVGGVLADRNKLDDAIRFLVLNTEFSPTSGFAYRQAAAGQLLRGDTTAAVTSLNRALAINPGDAQAKGMLGRLHRQP